MILGFLTLLKFIFPTAAQRLTEKKRNTSLYSSKNGYSQNVINFTEQPHEQAYVCLILSQLKTDTKNLTSKSSYSTATATYLLASRALISSIKPLPPRGSGPFPRPPSVLDGAEPPPPLELEESSPFAIHKSNSVHANNYS